jgi:DNA repair exonuclease SbcCD ATPase subunit
MKLLSLSIENFMGLIGEHELALDGLGLVHVAGANLDDPGNNSNGSGKSTLLEALTWALFGEGLPRPQGNSEQGIKADEVLNDQLGKQCKVVVRLKDDRGGERAGFYTVERWRKWKAGKGKQSSGVALFRGETQVQALDERETNRLICQALGITHDIWCCGVVFGQESGFNFCDATNKQRTEILTTVMGLEEIDRWLERCRDEKRALTNKMAESGGKLEVLKAALSRAEAADPQRRHDEWEVERHAAVLALTAHRDEIEQHGKSLNARLDAVPAPELTTAKAGFGVADEISGPYREADTVVRDAQREAQSTERALREAEQRLNRTMGTVNQAACPTCGQAITAQHRAACEAEGQAQVRQAGEAFMAAGAALQAAQGQFAQHQIAYQAASQAADLAVAQHSAQMEEYRRLTHDRGKLEQDLAAARANWVSIDRQLQAKEAERNPHGAAIAEHEALLRQMRVEIGVATADQLSIGESLEICLWWEKELPRFRTWMFDSIVDVLAAEANRWLNVMSGGVIWIQITTAKQVAKRLKDELDVQIYRWQPDGTIVCRPYRVWSGGEKRRVSLAVDLGLSRLMAQRASKAYRFIAIDEVDRHLDDRGREGLRLVLEQLRDDKDTCLAITHDPNFQASFDTEIRVTKARGQTTMEIRDARQQGDHSRRSPQAKAAEPG